MGSMVQASLEWVFCQPDNKDALSEETLHIFFRQFWESVTAAKIGEEGALGFAAFVRSRIIEPDIPPLPSTAKASMDELQSTPVDPADSGWSGWFEIDSGVNEETPEEEVSEEEEEEQLDNEDEDQETEAELMKECVRAGSLNTAASVRGADWGSSSKSWRMWHRFRPKRSRSSYRRNGREWMRFSCR